MQARDLGIGIILDDLDFPVEFNKRSKLSVNETSVTAKLLNINAGTANIQDAR
jgi:hypothetical protein|tara:strand:- start:245 stop:403 length:159 start_codon:yes stop_codon:yes gene_type:complete